MNIQKPTSDTEIPIGETHISLGSVESVVDTFYRKVAVDEFLAKPFESVEDWPDHIEKMVNFWWMKFGGTPFRAPKYNPVAKHYSAGFNDSFLERWLFLFESVLSEELTSEQYEFWFAMSQRMGKHLTKMNGLYKSKVEGE